MSSYYYLMSSLPMLRSDGEMPFDYSHFLDLCRGIVGESKYKLLENLTLDSKDGPLVGEWAGFYAIYAKELEYWRKNRLGQNASPPYDRDDKVMRVVSSAVGDSNPLNAELSLLSLLFEKLDELVGNHTFDDFSLFGYALKLKLLERKTVFDFNEGKAELTSIVENLEQQIMNVE